MGFFKRIAGLLGFAREEDHHQQQQDGGVLPPFASASQVPGQHRKGFSVPVQVPVDRAPQAPLLVFCDAGDGGIQGLKWYSRRLRIDEDGDVADEFLDEVIPDTSTSLEGHDKPLPTFQVKYSTKPAKVRNLALLPNGRIQHLVEWQGRLEWV